MEAIAEAGGAALLGIQHRHRLLSSASSSVSPRRPPAFVQRPRYAQRGWDLAIRSLSPSSGIVYPAFSLLTCDRDFVAHARNPLESPRPRLPRLRSWFRFAAIGMLSSRNDPLQHMRDDLATGICAAADDIAANRHRARPYACTARRSRVGRLMK